MAEDKKVYANWTRKQLKEAFDYDAFVSLLAQGKIYIDLRIGQYHRGAKEGQTHDHGTGFRIKEIDQPLLFKTNKMIV